MYQRFFEAKQTTVQEQFWQEAGRQRLGRMWNQVAAHWIDNLGLHQASTVRDWPILKIKPSQKGEDYDNASSRQLAKTFRAFLSNEHRDVDDFRREDFFPILIHRDGTIIDGNHRHYATKAIGQRLIPVIVLS
jgi:hypothetical protein